MYPVSYLINLYILSIRRNVLVMPLFVITDSVVFFPFFLNCFYCYENVYKLACKNLLVGSITH